MAITVRTTDYENRLIENLKDKTRQSVASKALIQAAVITVYDYPKLQDDHRKLTNKYNDLNNLMNMILRKDELNKDIISLIKKISDV